MTAKVLGPMSASSSLSSCLSHQQYRRSFQHQSESTRNDDEDEITTAGAWQRPSLRRAQNARNNSANACWQHNDATAAAGHKSLSQGRITEMSHSIAKKRRTQQHSHRLRAMLQKDLRIVSVSTRNSPNNHNNKKGKLSLSDYKQDIDSLLNSLHSTDFVGKIDPEYHSQYLPTSHTMPTF
ncbi:hypothetical protein IV203_019006 [Nitzschia inconspicua]|uniref:Uncharacterized protein n=1 Tax=Nitzschia inconspicua TaxID=303405 RepID=A0A9K3Q4J0_9STRA|nr:hypothetical protein IV203_019006 [Nitzschia inconspicua]